MDLAIRINSNLPVTIAGLPPYSERVLLYEEDFGWVIGQLVSTDLRGHHFQDNEGNDVKPLYWAHLPDIPTI